VRESENRCMAIYGNINNEIVDELAQNASQKLKEEMNI
jgi:hypothetical protein